MTKAQACRECITALTPPARAFERAQRQGLVRLDDQLGFVEVIHGIPPEPRNLNPDQLTLEGGI